MENDDHAWLTVIGALLLLFVPIDLAAQSSTSLEAPDHSPPRLQVNVGPLAAGRTMTFEGDSGTIRHSPSPYVGGMMRISARVGTLPKLEGFVVVDGELGYGLGRSPNLETDGPSNPSTELTYGGANVSLYRQLGETVYLGLGAGFQATSFTVSPNPRYTGHRYLAVDLSIRTRWEVVEDVFRLNGDVGAFPLFAVDQSDGAYGDATGFGVRLEGEAVWYPASNLPGLHLSALYRYQRYRAQFPISPIGTRGGISIDNQHLGALLIGYEL